MEPTLEILKALRREELKLRFSAASTAEYSFECLARADGLNKAISIIENKSRNLTVNEEE